MNPKISEFDMQLSKNDWKLDFETLLLLANSKEANVNPILKAPLKKLQHTDTKVYLP